MKPILYYSPYGRIIDAKKKNRLKPATEPRGVQGGFPPSCVSPTGPSRGASLILYVSEREKGHHGFLFDDKCAVSGGSDDDDNDDDSVRSAGSLRDNFLSLRTTTRR